MTIYKKLLIFVLSLSLIPVLITGLFGLNSASRALKFEILKKLESIADLKVQKIEAFLKERSGDAYVLSNSFFLKENFQILSAFFYDNDRLMFQKTRNILDHQLKLYDQAYEYSDIMLVNPHGIVIYTTNLSHFNMEYGKRIPDIFWNTFEKAKKELSFSPVYKGPEDTSRFLMTMAVPVYNDADIFLGEIFFEINMKVVYDLMDDKTGLGDTGETLIAQKINEGALFLNPLRHDPDAALKKTAGFNSDLPIINAIKGKTGSGISFDYHGDKVIAAWRTIPTLKWGMVAKMDISEAFESISSMRNRMIILFMISMGICVFVIIKITDSITTPVINLTRTTQKVMNGDMTARAETLSTDEIGELANNFNEMVGILTKTNETLKDAQRIAHLGNWELDLSRREMEWSDEMYEILELSRDNKPSHEALLNFVHLEDLEFVKLVHNDSSILKTPFKIQYRLNFPDEKIKYVEEQCETVFSKDGNPVRTVGILRDITEQTKADMVILKLNTDLENRVQKRTEQLETANRELEAFSYSVSHDLRAPLRSITGFAELLRKNIHDSLDEKSKHYLDVISQSTVQMGQLIDDILSFSRMSRTEMMESTIDFSFLIKNAVKTLDNDIKGRKINWEINDLPPAKGDINLLQLVITNLISNAVKFTKNRETAEIEIGATNDGNETIYFVKDNGAGFDMNYSNKLFGLFQRLHRAEDFSGTGVGLANVQRIIQRHGGRIWAQGKPDEGATFYFTIPPKGEHHA